MDNHDEFLPWNVFYSLCALNIYESIKGKEFPNVEKMIYDDSLVSVYNGLKDMENG